MVLKNVTIISTSQSTLRLRYSVCDLSCENVQQRLSVEQVNSNGYILYYILYDFHNFTLYSKFYLQLVIMNSLNGLGPVFQKSQTLSDLFWEPQFPPHLRKAEVLNHQTSQSCAKKFSGRSRNRPQLPVGL